MQIAILGGKGRMGKALYDFYKNKYKVFLIDIKDSCCKSLDDLKTNIDVLIDFSSPSSLHEIKKALSKKIYVISGTTGYDKKIIDNLKDKYPDLFYWKNNFSKGIDVIKKCFSLIKDEYKDIALIEVHSKSKKDAPSGTALDLAMYLEENSKDINSIRLNDVHATHVTIFSSLNERITIIHESLNLDSYVIGVDKVLKELFYDKKTIRGRML